MQTWFLEPQDVPILLHCGFDYGHLHKLPSFVRGRVNQPSVIKAISYLNVTYINTKTKNCSHYPDIILLNSLEVLLGGTCACSCPFENKA